MLCNITTAAVVMLGAAISQLGVAHAQVDNRCQGRVVVDTVYQNQISQGQFEYFFNIRNATRGSITADIVFSGFPAGVTLYSPFLPGIPLGTYASRSAIKFGHGTWGQVSVGTVNRAYDAAAGAGPTILVRNCRPI